MGATLPAQSASAAIGLSQSGLGPSPGSDASTSTSTDDLPVKVSAALPPVPGYLVSKICSGKFVDFTLLRPCHLKKLPTTEPSSFQILRMIRSDLAPVRSFVDWAETWAVYTGVLSDHDPKKVQNLIGYFLLLAAASREVPGLGWLDYDKAFRKLAEDDPNVNWGEGSPTLWVTTVITKGSALGSKDSSAAQQGGKKFCVVIAGTMVFAPTI